MALSPRRREWMREYMRTYREQHRDRIREIDRASAAKHRQSRTASLRKWEADNIERERPKMYARAQVKNALRSGRIVREPCEICGSVVAVAHHDDYSKPLEVRWLCRSHHYAEHRGESARAAA